MSCEYTARMEPTLDQLITFIGKHFHFTEEKYPALKGAGDKDRQLFALQHMSLHFSKSGGKIASVLESEEHGGELDFDELRVNTGKMLISVLKLAQLIDMSGADLVKAMEEKYKAKIHD